MSLGESITLASSSSSSSSSLSSQTSSQTCTQPNVIHRQASSQLVTMETDNSTSSRPMNIFGQATDFIDHHIQALRIGIALVGMTGVLLIGRSIRVMKTFCAVSDIPEEFIRKQMTLRGKVRGHEGHHVLVEHLPIIQGIQGVTKSHGESLLPVCFAGVHLSEGGLTRLATLIPMDSMIWFRLLAVNEAKQLECIVTRRKNMVWSLMVNEYLVRQGFAQVKPVHPSVALHPITVRLIQRLTKAEIYAERKAKGIWAKPPLWERMSERTQAVKDGSKERWVSTKRPFTVGLAAVKSAGSRVGAIFRWPKRTPKK